MAFRFARMLEDLIKKKCGPLTSIPMDLSFSRPGDVSATIRTLFEGGCDTADNEMMNMHQTLHSEPAYLQMPTMTS